MKTIYTCKHLQLNVIVMLVLFAFFSANNVVAAEVTASVSISEYATANSWSNATQYDQVVLDTYITANRIGTTNNGKWYSDWRFYTNGSSDGSFSIDASSGCTLKSVTFTYTTSNNGALYLGDDQLTSETEKTISGTSQTFTVKNTNTNTNGQVRITAISVTYEISNATYTATWYVNGSSVHSQTAAANTTLTAPDDEPTSTDCDGTKVFVGWTANQITGSTDTKPTDLFSDPTTKKMPSSDTDYHAVFATASSGGGTTTSTFVAADQEYTNGEQATEKVIDGVTYTWGEGAKYYTSGSSVRMYANNTLVISSTNTITAIDFTYSKGAFVQESASTGTVSDGDWSGSATEITFTNGTGDQVRISQIVVTIETPYSAYQTSCTPLASHTITISNGEHGTYSISPNTAVTSAMTAVLTVTPDEGYTSSASVTSGTAQISKSGNVYTITNVTSDITITITYATVSTYTVTLIDNGTTRATESVAEDDTYELPADGLSECVDAKFLGWTASSFTNGTTTKPTLVSGEQTITEDITYYAVYQTTEQGDDDWTQMTSTDQLSAGDKIVIVPVDDTHAMYQETVSSSYVGNWSFDASEIDNDDKNWFTVTESSESGKWYLGDATNGYLYNSKSNNLAVNTEGNKSSWEISWNSTGSGFTFKSEQNRYLACRADLTGNNQYKYRMNGEAISASNNSLYYFDLYKTGGTTIYTNRPQCCTPPTNKLQLEASATTVIRSGTVTLTVTGGNGKDISWTASGGTLSSTTNSGATIDLPTATETKTYTITASQEDNNTDPDNVVCGATQKVVITVKAQFTITYNIIIENVEDVFSTTTMVDGADYTLPDLSEDFTCPDGIVFAGWASSSTATTLEKTAGTVVTADGDKQWWAVWGSSAPSSETVDLYQEVTDISQLSEGDKVIIASASVWKAMSTDQRTNNRGSATTYEYETDDTKTYFLSTDTVQVFTLGGNSSDGWSFYDGSKYIYAASSSNNYLKSQATNNENGLWTISISESVATIKAKGTNTKNLLQYNKTYDLFSCYGSTQTDGAVMLYRRTGETATIISSSSDVTTNSTCVSGATIRATGNSWITSAQGQKVKTVYQIVAKGFESAQTLSISGNTDPAHFSASLAATAVPQEPSLLETTLTIEYTPTESDVQNTATITLAAGDVTRTITINGRSVPQEFVLVTKKGNWYALPANMSQAGQHNGINVSPNDATNPTQVPVASPSALYSLKSVANARYAVAGSCVRLVGNDDKCLWATSTSGATDIRNYAALGETNGAQYEWNLYTENGTTYTITSPQHPDTKDGRMLAYGARFALYKQVSEFYILPVGCSAQPENIEVSPAREQVTISFESNATELVVNIYDADDNSLAATATVNASPVTISDLKEMHEYTFEIIPDGNNNCKVGDEFMTTGPSIDVVEWMEDAVIIYVDKDEDLHPKVIVDGQEEHGSISSGTIANELFFAKYFEGAGSMKLISIFNGTVNDIDLAAEEYNIHYICVGNNQNTFSPENDKDYPLADLGTIKSGQEIIFFTGPSEANLQDCSTTFLDSVARFSGEGDNPRWIKCDNSTYYGNTKFPTFVFSGNDILVLQKGSTDIDIFGAKNEPPSDKNCRDEHAWTGTAINMDYGKNPNDPMYKPLFEASSLTPSTDAERIEILKGFGVDLENEIINITTARCILFRNKSVRDGFNAVNNNTDDFLTFTEAEWNGRSVCMTKDDYTQAGVTNDAKATCNSYQDIGKFDYSTYYIDEVNIIPGEELDTYGWKPEENLYKIDINNLENYTCLFLTFQLTDDDGKIITSQRKQVPIMVKSDNATTDELFYNIIDGDYENSKKRCSTCNVVVMRDAVLTKAEAGATHDVNKVNNIQVYPGGKLIVPADGSDFQIHSLSFLREEDDISIGDIQGDLTIKQANGIYLDVRIDPSNWHWLSLPFDCNVADVKFSNGDDAKYNTDWFLMYYDGKQRAATQAGGCWKVYEDPVIHAGQGLIVGVQGLSDKPKVKLELRFPMANDAIAAERQNKTLDVYAWGLGNESLSTDTKPQEHFGWNLVGNPYMNYYRKGNLNSFNGLTLGKMIWDTEGHDTYYNNGDGIAYVAVPINGGWTAYEQKPVAGNDLLPFTSYFVQVGVEGTNTSDEQLTVLFDHTNRGKSSMIRRVVEEKETPAFVGVFLTAPNGEKDETALVVSDRFHDNFEIGKDMYKWFGDYYKYYSKPVVYTISPNHKLAFNALPEASAAAQVPMGFYAATNGNYTLTLNRNSDLQRAKEVWLYDAQENTYTNLMQENYQFYTTKQQNESRFFLSVKLAEKQDNTPTDAFNTYNAGIRVTTNQGTLTLTGLPDNAHVWVYSANGSLLINETTNVWQQTYHLPPGVYNIRVVAQEAVTLRGIVK